MGGTITEWRKSDGHGSRTAPRRQGGAYGPAEKGPMVLEYAWYNGSTVRWELVREGDSRTRLLFTHRHVISQQLMDAAKGWHYHLDLPALELDGEPMPHNPVQRWDEITREATVRYKIAVLIAVPATPFSNF